MATTWVPEEKLKPKKINTLPVHINPDFLQPDGCLLSPAEIANIPKNIVNTRLSKKTATGLSFSVIVTEDDEKNRKIYAVYGHDIVLGTGQFGKVKYAQDVQTREFVALKVSTEQKKYLVEEVNLLFKATGVGEFVADPDRTKKKFHVIMKLATGESADKLLRNNAELSFTSRLMIAHGMLKELKKLHEESEVLHRDLKPANIVVHPLTKKTNLVDFGFAMPIDEASQDKNCLGSGFYMAPEVARKQNNSDYSKKSDAYAMGVTLADWFGLDINTYKNNDNLSQVKNIKETAAFARNIPDREIRLAVLTLIKDLCQNDVSKRIDVIEAERRFEAIIKKLEFKQLQANTIGVLNVEEYFSLPQAERVFMRNALKGFDQVTLVYPLENPSITDLKLSILQRELEIDKICISETAYGYAEKNKTNVLSALATQLSEKYPSHLQLLHVTTNDSLYSSHFLGTSARSATIRVDIDKTSDDYKQAIATSPINKADFEKFKTELNLELMRVKYKYGENSYYYKSRENMIFLFIHNLESKVEDKNNPLTYKQFSEQLNQLSISLHHIRQPNTFLGLFKGKSHTEEVVNKMRDEITPKKNKI